MKRWPVYYNENDPELAVQFILATQEACEMTL